MSSIFLAAWAKLQSKLMKSSHVIFGLWQAGRSANIPGIENLAYPCVNILPMQVNAGGGIRVIDVALGIQEDLIRRTPVIEQTDLVNLDQWLGGNGKPLCNVFVNIVPIGCLAYSADHESLFDEVEIPYIGRDSSQGNDGNARLPVSSLIRVRNSCSD